MKKKKPAKPRHRYVLQKGMAGLGNRLKSLGLAVDLALRDSIPLCIDWTDSSWVDGFSPYFKLEGIELMNIEDIPDNVVPTHPGWKEVWRQPVSPNDEQRVNLLTCRNKQYPGDLRIVCSYGPRHSDKLYQRLRPARPVLRRLKKMMEHRDPEDTVVYHFRHTDKQTDNWERWVREAEERAGKESVAVITDSLVVKEGLPDRIYCPSFIIPPHPSGGGVHHVRTDIDTKRKLNTSCVAEMWYAMKAREFIACCPSSTYAHIIERYRRCNKNR